MCPPSDSSGQDICADVFVSSSILVTASAHRLEFLSVSAFRFDSYKNRKRK